MSSPAGKDRSLARLLLSKGRADASGVIRATRGKLKRVFCMEHGWLVYGASNLVEEQLHEYMVRHRVLAPAQRAEAVASGSKSKQDPIDYLLERGVVERDQVQSSMEGLVETLMDSCLEWPEDANYQFSAGRPDVASKVTVRISPVSLLLRHARRYPASLDAVRVRLGPPDAKLHRTGHGDEMLKSMNAPGATRFLLESTDGSTTVGELLATCPESEEETLRSLYGLLLAGGVEEVRGYREPARATLDSPLTEEECVALLGRADGADHYAVLGLERNATRDRIREAYYSLARRYHPDRFRSGEMHKFLPQMEAYFTKVTEAYNTLHTDDLRAAYDDQQAERGADTEAVAGTAHLARQNFLRARALIERRRYADAAGFLENAIRQDDSQSEYHLELGKLLSGNPRRRAEAEEHLMRAAELDPSSPHAYVALGHLYRKAARDADAARMFREALRWEPGHAEAAATLAEMGQAAEPATEGGILRHLFRG